MGGQQQQQQPDVVILHANHWVLKVIAEGYIEATDRDLAALSALPEYYVESFIRNFTMLAQQVIPIQLHGSCNGGVVPVMAGKL